MNNLHFIQYNQWKQVTLFIMVAVFLGLTSAQAYYTYKLYTLKKNVASLIKKDPDTEIATSNQIAAMIKKIDEQDLFKLYDALVEIMPPDVKVERCEYHHDTGTTITCRAQENSAMIRLLELVSKNSILKKLRLKKSTHEKESLLVILQDEPVNKKI